MRLEHQCWFEAAILSSISVLSIVAQKKVWPLETNVSANQTVYEGETVKFYCIVTNDRTARIQWLRIPPGGVPRHMCLINGDSCVLRARVYPRLS